MDEFDPLEFLERAVAIDSSDSVHEMRSFVLETLQEIGVSPSVDSAGNILAERRLGVEAGPRYVLNTHIDTVAPHVEPRRENGRLHGRGACDAKGPLAAMVWAFLSVDVDTAGSVTLAITPDEESKSTGAAALSLDADGVIVGEPTGLDVCTAARGRFEATVTLSGVNAHAASPEAGVNAVRAAGSVLEAMDAFDPDGSGIEAHHQLGPPLLTPTIIEGGEVPNQIPDQCRITVDRRSVPPETSDGFRSALETYLEAIVPDSVSVSVSMTNRPTPFLEAFATDETDPLVTTLQQKANGAIRPFGAATEASYFAKDAPTVVFGPGVLADDDGPVAHADREYVILEDVVTAGKVIQGTLESLLEASPAR